MHPNSRPILLLLAGRCSQMHRLPLSNYLPNIIFLCIALRSTLRRHSHLEAQIPLTVRAQRHNSSSGEQLSSRHLLATRCTRHPGKKKPRPLHAAGNRTRVQREKAYEHCRTPTGSYAHNRDPTGSKQNRIAVWAPTKCPRATDNNTKSLRVPKF